MHPSSGSGYMPPVSQQPQPSYTLQPQHTQPQMMPVPSYHQQYTSQMMTTASSPGMVTTPPQPPFNVISVPPGSIGGPTMTVSQPVMAQHVFQQQQQQQQHQQAHYPVSVASTVSGVSVQHQPGVGGASAPQPQQPQHHTPSQPDLLLFDPVAKAKMLIRKELRFSLTRVVTTANELIKQKIISAAASNSSAMTPSTMEQQVATPASVGMTPGAEESGAATPNPPSGAGGCGSSEGSGGCGESKRRPRSPIHLAVQLRKALEHFYSVCDQIEYQFVLIQEAQKQSRLNEKNLPIKIMQTDGSGVTSGATAHNQVTLDQYKRMAEHQIRYASAIRNALTDTIRELSTIGDQPTDNSDENSEEEMDTNGDCRVESDKINVKAENVSVETIE